MACSPDTRGQLSGSGNWFNYGAADEKIIGDDRYLRRDTMNLQ